MKAEDTVMSKEDVLARLREMSDGEWLHTLNNIHDFERIWQAEISFKAGDEVGYRRGMTESAELAEVAVYSGKQAGIKEVVETFHDDICGMANRFPTAKELTGFINKWQAKLKEWGVK